MFKKIYLLPLISICLLLISCGDDITNVIDQASEKDGASDGGGGIVGGSTAAQIEQAIVEARDLIVDPRYRYYFSMAVRTYYYGSAENIAVKECKIRAKDIYCLSPERVEYIKTEKQNSKDNRKAFEELPDKNPEEWREISEESQKKFHELTKKNKELTKQEERWAIDNYIFKQYVRNIPLDLTKEDACYYGNKQKADASVTELTENARICFSLKKLQRIPIASLNKHIVSLWMHELAHMEGYNEKQAKIFEGLALISYEKYLLANTEMTIAYGHYRTYISDLSFSLMHAYENLTNLSQSLKDNTVTSKDKQLRRIYHDIIKAYENAEKYVNSTTPQSEGGTALTNPLYTTNVAYTKYRDEIREKVAKIHHMLNQTFKVEELLEYPTDLSVTDALSELNEIYSLGATVRFEFEKIAPKILCERDLSLTGDNADIRFAWICSLTE